MIFRFERVAAFFSPVLPATALQFVLPIGPDILSATASIVGKDQVNNELFHADRDKALRMLVGRGLLGQEGDLASEVLRIQESRHVGSYLVVRFSGPAELDMTQLHRRLDGYVFGFDLAQKVKVRELTDPTIDSVIAASLTATGRDAHLVRVADSVYYFDESGLPYHSSSLSVGNITVSVGWSPEQAGLFRRHSTFMASDSALRRACRLYAQTLQDRSDRFRNFLAAWTALEVLAQKAFARLEKDFLASVSRTDAAGLVVATMGSSMRPPLPLLVQFSVVSACLRLATAEADVALFASAKKTRDDLAHGADIEDAALPQEAVTQLLADYLQAYIARFGPPDAIA